MALILSFVASEIFGESFITFETVDLATLAAFAISLIVTFTDPHPLTIIITM
ncbi:hypothetical protein D3C78_1564770 [compost metagenome]